MPEYVYVDTRLLWLLMLLSTGMLQYLLIGAVKLVLRVTRERHERELAAKAARDQIVKLSDFRKEQQR